MTDTEILDRLSESYEKWRTSKQAMDFEVGSIRMVLNVGRKSLRELLAEAITADYQRTVDRMTRTLLS